MILTSFKREIFWVRRQYITVTIAMECILFGAVVLVATAVWVYVLRDRSFTFLAYAMYFPGAAAIFWSAMKGSLFEFLYNASGVTQVRSWIYVPDRKICKTGRIFFLKERLSDRNKVY